MRFPTQFQVTSFRFPNSRRFSLKQAIALGARLRKCRNVITLGVRPNFSDYTAREQELIRDSEKIYYPSAGYSDLFDAMGKETFPRPQTYRFALDKIKQTALFGLLGIPHPRTRVFYGSGQKKQIVEHFRYPFIAKIPRGSSMGKGVHLIRNREDLEAYCRIAPVAYIQDYLADDRDIRAVVIGGRVVLAYWRFAPPGDHRTNVAAGGTIRLDAVPAEALDLARFTARSCGWDDVGIDIRRAGGGLFVLEANMRYGRVGFRRAGIDYPRLMEAMIENGEI